MSRRQKILVVEDEPAVASLMTFLLSRAGYDVETAFTGRRGLELATTQKFDLILLDVDLPGINGFDICRDLKQRHISYRTPVIFVSGSFSDGHRQRAAELGAADFISKPFNAADFVSRVRLHAATVQTSSTATAMGDTN